MEARLCENLMGNVRIPVDMRADPEMDAVEIVKAHGTEFAHPMPSKGSKELSTNDAVPTTVLSWHGITVKPRKKSNSVIPLVSTIKRCFSKDSEDFEYNSLSQTSCILDNVYGVAHSGEVLAILGASGAGKTTLLNVLTQRNLSTVKTFGRIRLNSYDIDKSVVRRISAYVEQDDLFIGTMTVVEHLRFMALLRMGKFYKEYEREKRVQSVMVELGLTGCADTIIGWPHRLQGISGGERKRLAFASEILTSPPLLFCDEPTSGLDSYLAQQVIQVLKHIARRKNITIVLTIDQPSSQVFEMFDKVCLLAEGRVVFLGQAGEVLKLWGSMGYPLPENFNPADHFISTLAAESSKNRESRSKTNKFCEIYLQSECGQKVYAQSKGENMIESSSTSSGSLAIWQDDDRFRQNIFQSYKATWFQQLSALTKRSFLVTLREPMLLKVRIFQTIFIAVLLGVIYFNTPIKQTTIMNINGLIYQAVGNMNFMYQFAAISTFCEELPIFMREHTAHLYRVDTFFIAKNLADLGQYLLYPIIFSAIVYWMSGLVRDVAAYALFSLSCVLICNVAVSLAYAGACIFGSIDVASTILPILVIPLLAFGGFYVNQETLPFYFYPLKYLSYFGYAYETGAINQWTRVEYIPGCYEPLNHTKMSTTCSHNGDDVLASLSFRPSNLVLDYIVMVAMIIVLRIVAFISLWMRTVTKR